MLLIAYLLSPLRHWLVWLFEHLLFPENVILDAPTIRSILVLWFEWFHVGVEKLVNKKAA
jgi:hypothetical protein